MANIMDLFSPAKVVETNFDIEGIKEACKRVIKMQNMVGGKPKFKIKIGSGIFIFTTGNGRVNMEKFQGIIVTHHRSNALFDISGTGEKNENTPPICSSTDGIMGINNKTGEYADCEKCPYNQFGTAENGKGKACKNMHRLYILIEGCPMPAILSLPPTSLEFWRNYSIMDVAAMGLDMSEVVTEFSLTEGLHLNKNEYSIVNFKLIGKVSQEIREYCAETGASIEKTPRPAIEADEYNREPDVIIQQDDENSAENDIENDTQNDIENDIRKEPENNAEIIDNEVAGSESDFGAGIDAIIDSEEDPEEIDFDSL